MTQLEYKFDTTTGIIEIGANKYQLDPRVNVDQLAGAFAAMPDMFENAIKSMGKAIKKSLEELYQNAIAQAMATLPTDPEFTKASKALDNKAASFKSATAAWCEKRGVTHIAKRQSDQQERVDVWVPVENIAKAIQYFGAGTHFTVTDNLQLRALVTPPEEFAPALAELKSAQLSVAARAIAIARQYGIPESVAVQYNDGKLSVKGSKGNAGDGTRGGSESGKKIAIGYMVNGTKYDDAKTACKALALDETKMSKDPKGTPYYAAALRVYGLKNPGAVQPIYKA